MLTLPGRAAALYEAIADLPIVSPHGHCDPGWFAANTPFPDPAALLIQPDHYVLRMLYSQGVALEDLGIGPGGADRDPRDVFALFAQHWDDFLGTPSRLWLEYTFRHVLGVETALTADTAGDVYDQIASRLRAPGFRPRTLFQRFGIDLLATTDAATDALVDHATIAASGWDGRVIPTFRPDDVLNPLRPHHPAALSELQEMTGQDIAQYGGFLDALRDRRAAFRDAGATATDHDVPDLATTWLSRDRIEDLHTEAVLGTISPTDAARYYGHLLVEMAQMSAEDGMVMQIHAGSRRNTNRAIFDAFGADKGADIPMRTDWVGGLATLLDRVGNDPRLRLIVFT
ncbi:MAG: glucuronate isomerase, partial [Pseudomonadota bacterium]